MSQSVEEIVRAATAAAIASAQTATTNPAPAATDVAPYVAPAAAAPAAYAPPQAPKTLEDVAAESSVNVDGYVKVKHEGIYLGDDKTAFEDLKVGIRGSEISLYAAVSFGNPAKYGRCYNGVTEAYTNKPWAQFVAEAMRMDGRCKGAYDAADVPLYLMEDVISQRGDKKGQVIFKAGSVLGYTTSKSAMRELRTFIKSTVLPLGKEELIVGTAKLKPLKNDQGEWGVLDFGSAADWKVHIEE